MTHPTVAAIVPALNEEKTIGPVVKTLVDSRLFQDVIVVSDGSTDRTADVARQHGATHVYELLVNGGKGHAMRYGVQQTNASILLFADADLIDFTQAHVHLFLDPVVSGKTDMCIGIVDRGAILNAITPWLPLVSGMRAMRREIFERIPEPYVAGYMIEGALNYACAALRKRYSVVILPKLAFRRKIQKLGMWKGLAAYVRMGYQQAKAILVVRVAHVRGKFV